MNLKKYSPGAEIAYDEIDYSGPDAVSITALTDPSSSDEALVNCLNTFGTVDLEYMSKVSGLSVPLLVSELRGKAIIQDPALFASDRSWSISKGWVPIPRYLCGNVAQKIDVAAKMNKKFPHAFDVNLMKLRELLPAKLTADLIHPSLGAVWLPARFYASFIKSLLGCSVVPDVTYTKELAEWKITLLQNDKTSVGNLYKYGTNDLSAVKIIELTMNARTVKVYDVNYTASGKTERILNKTKTLEAQEKQSRITAKFNEWVRADPGRAERIAEYYNEAFVGYASTPYDGSFLKLPGLSPEIKLYKHQLSAIARILLSGSNLLLAHDVGTGKTYEMIVSAHELHRMGVSRKNLIVVPKNVLKATVDAHRKLYPDDKILAIYSKDFTPAKRTEALERLRDGDHVCVYMAYPSFDMLSMSKQYRLEQKREEIRKLERAAFAAARKHQKRALLAEADGKRKELAKFELEAKDTPWPSFDSLGITTLFLDEAHNYKNIPLSSRTEGIVGMHSSGSKKCREMLEKVHYLPRVIFTTGTPLTNSLADLFVFQLYLQPHELEFMGIDSFDMWINTFGERETNYEIDVSSSSIQPVTRFSAFHNLPELMGLFSNICDFHHSDGEAIPRYAGPTDVSVPRNNMQTAYLKVLLERTEAIRSHKVRRDVDNLLKITTDGRKCALDIRLVDLDKLGIRLDSSIIGCKTDVCARKVFEVYHRRPGTSQLVFCDIGTPRRGFNVYEALKAALMRYGIPEKEIAFIHDAESERARDKLFAAVNSGKVRIVIGSTMKLGIGVNVQERLSALHHLSVPWRPADMVQREGRILRQGNTCEEVEIFRYVTEGTFDSYSWQLLENKQRFISSFLSGAAPERDRDDISDAVLSYAEIKALAIGDPLIKRRVEVSNRVERTRMAMSQRQRRLMELKALLESIPDKIANLTRLKGQALADARRYRACKERIPAEERQAFGEELLEAIMGNSMLPAERLFTEYQGFDVILPPNMTLDRPFVLVRGKSGSEYHVDMDGGKAMGCSMRLDRLLDGLEDTAKELGKRIAEERKNMKTARAELDEGNRFKDELEKLSAELAEIDLQLKAKGE